MRQATSLLLLLPFAIAFAPPSRTRKVPSPAFPIRQQDCRTSSTIVWQPLFSSSNNEDSSTTPTSPTTCWNPKLRRVMGAIASLGVAETAYLTYTKLVGVEPALCGLSSDTCGSVLNGPYSVLPVLGIPLATVGLMAYASVAALAVGPILLPQKSNNDNDEENRVWLTALTTAMGAFSVFLMTFLFGVLQESCVFCVTSAVLSVTLAKLSWFGGALPKGRVRSDAISTVFGTSLAAMVAAVALFVSYDDPSAASSLTAQLQQPTGSALLADASSVGQRPPSVTTSSSARTAAIATQLQALDTHFYGAFWCSHCFEQKQELGRQAMAKIPYIECSKDGYNSEAALCKKKDIPGYPTWEINGKLYPGEQALEELEEIIQQSQARK